MDVIPLERLHVSEFIPFEYKCDWSAIAPDGEQLLCGKKDGLWYGSLTNGVDKRIGDNAYAQWLPNGKQIAYYDGAPPGGTTELYLLDIVSGNKTLISKATSWLHIRVSPRGEILFPEEGDLFLWDPTTETKRLLLSSSTGAETGVYPGQFSIDIRVMDSNYALSPDGQHLVVQSVLYDEGTLALVDLANHQVITLTNTIENLPSPFGWSPDGRLAFDVQGKGDIPELWVINADGSDKHRVLQGTQRGAYTRMTWMPDGQTLLFVDRSLTGEEGVYDEYYAINITKGEPKKLFENGRGMALSADGHELFVGRNAVELQQFFIATLDW
jgi:Tol biopolymer transport system component